MPRRLVDGFLQEVEGPFVLAEAQVDDGPVEGRDRLVGRQLVQRGQKAPRLLVASRPCVQVPPSGLGVRAVAVGIGLLQRGERCIDLPLSPLDQRDEGVRVGLVRRDVEDRTVGGDRLFPAARQEVDETLLDSRKDGEGVQLLCHADLVQRFVETPQVSKVDGILAPGRGGARVELQGSAEVPLPSLRVPVVHRFDHPESRMGFGEVGVQLEPPLRRCACSRVRLGSGENRERGELGVRRGQSAPGVGESGVQIQGPLELAQGLAERGLIEFAQEVAPLQVRGIRLRARGPVHRQPGPLPCRNVDRKGLGHLLSDLTLHSEDLGELRVVGLGPEMFQAPGMDEPDGDANPAALPAHASLEECVHLQVASDLGDASPTFPIGQNRGPGDHPEASQDREAGDQLFGEPVCKVGVTGIGTQVGEGQHRDPAAVVEEVRRGGVG